MEQQFYDPASPVYIKRGRERESFCREVFRAGDRLDPSLAATIRSMRAMAIHQQPPLSVTQSRWHFFAGA